ncbi:hypothetical protein TB1_000545 [Malus domestica]
MLVDGEACTLPQLELLEVAARTIQPMLEWGGSGLAVSDGLSNLLKCRPPGYHPLQISSSTEIASSKSSSSSVHFSLSLSFHQRQRRFD